MQLEGLPRNWPSVELPGHREHREKFSTYTAFSYDELPPIERELDDDLNWLLAEKATETSLVGLSP